MSTTGLPMDWQIPYSFFKQGRLSSIGAEIQHFNSSLGHEHHWKAWTGSKHTHPLKQGRSSSIGAEIQYFNFT